MLRSPLAVFSEFRGTTGAVVVVLAVAMWFVTVGLAAALQLQTATDGWWEQFLPVVYLEAQIDGDHQRALKAEIEGWSEVASVAVDEPEALLARLEAHLGDDAIGDIGVDASMMPTGLIVRPRVWRPGQVEALARLEALEVRPSVIAVDAPKPGALAWVDGARKVIIGWSLMVLILFGGALIGLGAFLRRLQEHERGENHLLELFGASPSVLRRSTLLRGVILGTAAGTLGGLAFLLWSLSLDGLVVDLVGVGALSAERSALWACALVPVGMVSGALVGWICGWPRAGGNGEGRESLLDWPKESA